MTAIEKLTEIERNMLLRLQLVPLIDKTVAHLRDTQREVLAMEWDQYSHILITLVTTARQEIYDARKAKHKRDDT